MLAIKGKKIARLAIRGELVARLAYGGRLIFESVRSCFGSGRWVQKKPWLGKEAWKND